MDFVPFTEVFILPCFLASLIAFHLRVPKDDFAFLSSFAEFICCLLFFNDFSFVKFSVGTNEVFFFSPTSTYVRLPSFCSSPASWCAFYLLLHTNFLLLCILGGVVFHYLPIQDSSVSVLSRLRVPQSGFRIPSEGR